MPPTRHIFSFSDSFLRLLVVVLGVAALSAGTVASTYAQGASTGKLQGTVRDAEGRGVPSANVLIQELGDGQIADEAGRFSFEAVPQAADVLPVAVVALHGQ